MKGRGFFFMIVFLSICVILLVSIAEVTEQEPFGLHIYLDGKRILLSMSDLDPDDIRLPGSDPVTIHNPFDMEQCIATVAVLSCSFPRCSGPVDAGSFPLTPGEAGPGSPTVLRI